MIRSVSFAATILAAGLLAGCAPGTTADPDPAVDPPGAQTPCIVGEWELDVADYASQSETYVVGLGIPIEGFAMDGAGTIQFTADGLVATTVDLTTSGTIVAGETRVPFNTPSNYAGSGDWGVGSDDETIDLANWANVLDADVTVDPSAPAIPVIDYTDIPSVGAACTSTTLVLQAPGAPLVARWNR